MGKGQPAPYFYVQNIVRNAERKARKRQRERREASAQVQGKALEKKKVEE